MYVPFQLPELWHLRIFKISLYAKKYHGVEVIEIIKFERRELRIVLAYTHDWSQLE